MTDRDKHGKTEHIDHGRRDVLRAAAVLGAGTIAAPYLIRSASAQAADLGPYTSAKIKWRQAEGEQITVGVIPAGYFDNLVSITPDFEALTGIKVRYEKIPPGQVRQKAMLDLSSKTGTYATVATDCMYYPLYAANKWVEPLDTYLNDASLTDPAWFQYDDIHKAWRDANTVDGKPYAIPYDGEMTVQVYRKDLYDAKGLKPAETLEQFVENAKALHDPSNRMWGAALRGFAGAGQNMYIYPSIFRSYGGNWMSGSKIDVTSKEAVASLDWYVDTLTKYAPQAVRNWNWPDIADAFAQGTIGAYIDAHSSAAVLNNAEKSKVIGKIGFARWPKGPAGQARHLDLELGFSDQRRAEPESQAGDLAVHLLGRIGGNPGANFMEVRRRRETFRTESFVGLEIARVYQTPERQRPQFRRSVAAIAADGHRRRLASARAAMAGAGRSHGDGDSVGAGRAEEIERGARRGPGPHRPDHEGLTRHRPLAALARPRRGGNALLTDCTRNRRSYANTGRSPRAKICDIAVPAGVPGPALDHDAAADLSGLE